MTKEGELFEAYHNMAVETNHLLALHQRMAIIMGAAKQSMHKLEDAVRRVHELEKEVAASAPPGGAA